MKHISVCMLCCALCVFASANDEAAEGSGGLDRMLRLAHVGVSFSDFVAAHPEAVYSDHLLRDIDVSPDQPAALLITHEADPFLGLRAFANIGFRDEMLYELVAVWTGEEDDVHVRRRRFFTAIVQRHGHGYIRETILVDPHTPEERPVAVFMWEDDAAVTLAFYTASSPLDPDERAALTYAQFTPGDPFLHDILREYAPDDDEREEAWEPCDDILSWLEAME